MSIIIINANLSAESSTQSLSEIVYTEIKKEDAGSSLISLHELPIPVCDGRESFGNENVKKLTDLMAKATVANQNLPMLHIQWKCTYDINNIEQMKMKIDALERKVYWLEEWKKNREEKEVQRYYKNKNA